MTIYKKNNEVISKASVTKEQKLINMYNQLYGTNYTVESVGIDVIKKNKATTRPVTNNNKYFAYLLRTGEVFNPQKVHAEEKRKELKSLKASIRKDW